MNAPPEGSDTSEEVGRRARHSVFPCVSAADLLEKMEKKVKRNTVALSRLDKTRAASCRGAGRVFALTDSRLMQNKRASLNIQQERLQSQHSIWPLLLCGTPSFHFSAPSFSLIVETFLMFLFGCFYPRPCVFIFPPRTKEVNILFSQTADRPFTYSSLSTLEMKCLL